jgi:phosphohistidine phosphatase
MILHIVRHAEAVDRSQDVPEEHRYLTRRGRKRFRKVAKTLSKAGTHLDTILTSPLIRAVQTADILAERLRYEGELVATPLLASGFRADSLDELLDAFPQAEEVALVGHEPDVGRLVQSLLGTEQSCSLTKGAIVSLERTAGEQGKAKFIQLITGGGKIVTSTNKALSRLQGDQQH